MNTGKLSFVVHEHDATTLHFDFRLQIGSGMPSWAIPRGPTLDSNVKRLAVETTVHSLEYRNFEGVIEEGKYGAGPVLIWDSGTYIPEVEVYKGVRETINDFVEGQKEMKEGLKKGEIKFFLQGKRLKDFHRGLKMPGF